MRPPREGRVIVTTVAERDRSATVGKSVISVLVNEYIKFSFQFPVQSTKIPPRLDTAMIIILPSYIYVCDGKISIHVYIPRRPYSVCTGQPCIAQYPPDDQRTGTRRSAFGLIFKRAHEIYYGCHNDNCR